MKKTFYFDPYATGVAVFLGPMEARLMELVWQKGNLTVKTALFYLQDEKDRAYTTVMTVLGRLAEKGLLQKRKEGRNFVYTPAMDRTTFLKQRVQVVFDCLKRNFNDLI
jgi:predicted transcriptional regulator